jgi:hypothetical protein
VRLITCRSGTVLCLAVDVTENTYWFGWNNVMLEGTEEKEVIFFFNEVDVVEARNRYDDDGRCRWKSSVP